VTDQQLVTEWDAEIGLGMIHRVSSLWFKPRTD